MFLYICFNYCTTIVKKKIVISGGPGSGKTTIINALTKQGFHCEEEFSRHIIEEGIRLGNGVVPWDKLDLFTEKVFEGRIKQFYKGDQFDETVFYDRSIIDSIAYMEHDQEMIPERYIQMAKKLRYHSQVFITPYWDDIYTTDNQRKEPSEKARSLEKSIINCYEKYHYDIILVPKTSVEERIEFILKTIHE